MTSLLRDFSDIAQPESRLSITDERILRQRNHKGCLVAHLVTPCGAILPDSPIDVTEWQEDEEFGNYPEGARSKAAVFPPETEVPVFINPARRYLFKRSNRRYPEQYWAEIAAYHIGCLLGVPVPPAYPSINQATGECAALIEWFYQDGAALFVMGGHFMQQIIDGFDRKTGRQHNFQTIHVLFRALRQKGLVEQGWEYDWIRMLLFDALCGDTDRHQDNWGIVFDLTQNPTLGRLSPCYDNGTSLGHELWEHHQGQRWNEARWQKYIDDGTHHMKWDQASPTRMEHIDGICRVAALFPSGREIACAPLEAFDLAALRDTLKAMVAIVTPVPLSNWRADLIYRLVSTRRELLLAALQ